MTADLFVSGEHPTTSRIPILCEWIQKGRGRIPALRSSYSTATPASLRVKLVGRFRNRRDDRRNRRDLTNGNIRIGARRVSGRLDLAARGEPDACGRASGI